MAKAVLSMTTGKHHLIRSDDNGETVCGIRYKHPTYMAPDNWKEVGDIDIYTAPKVCYNCYSVVYVRALV